MEDLSVRQATERISGILGSQTEETNSPSPKEVSERTSEESHNDAESEEERLLDTDVTEDVDASASDDASIEEEESAEGEAASEEEVIDSISALAEELGADEDEVLNGIGVDDGWGNVIPLGEALNGFREARTANLEKQAALEQQYQAKIQEVDAQTAAEIQKVAGLAQALVAEMNAEFEGVDMEELKLRDPLAYVDLVEKRQRRSKMIEDAVNMMDGAAATRQQRAGESIEQIHQREAGMLRQKMPHWFKDQKTIQNVVKENTEYMKSLGFDDAAIASVTDHRHIIALHEAAQWRKSQKQAKGKTLDALRKQKGLKRPNLAKRATARVDQSDPNVSVRKGRLKDFSKTRSVKDAGKLLETFIQKS